MAAESLTQTIVKERLDYDPDTGVVRWKVSPARRVKIGDVAGYMSNTGYINIEIFSKAYRLHRVIWLMVYGSFPDHVIDHINGNRSDNRLVNLRAATNKQNGENQCLQVNNSSGFRGVSWHSSTNKWQARVCHHRSSYYLGTFDTAEEAARVVKGARDLLFTHHHTEHSA